MSSDSQISKTNCWINLNSVSLLNNILKWALKLIKTYNVSYFDLNKLKKTLWCKNLKIELDLSETFDFKKRQSCIPDLVSIEHIKSINIT